MPRPKLNDQYLDTLPECPHCGTPVIWLYNASSGKLRAYEKFESEPNYDREHYPYCYTVVDSMVLGHLTEADYLSNDRIPTPREGGGADHSAPRHDFPALIAGHVMLPEGENDE